MRSLLAFGVVALIVAASGPAQEPPVGKGPKIAGETAYGTYDLVRLKAAGVEPKATLRWRVTPDAGVQRADTASELLQFVAPPGSYVVDLLAVKVVGEKAEVEEARVTVVISDKAKLPPTDKTIRPRDK
jgi:hypothetical protein